MTLLYLDMKQKICDKLFSLILRFFNDIKLASNLRLVKKSWI